MEQKNKSRFRRNYASEPQFSDHCRTIRNTGIPFPGRIDLGLGRAPGTDGLTAQALGRNPAIINEQFQDRF
jgi:hypothetical protein